jgi:RNA polymerase sigma-70 factor (ECF subfamily)
MHGDTSGDIEKLRLIVGSLEELRPVIRRMSAGLSEGFADIEQELVMRAWQHRGTIRDECVMPWMKRVLDRLIIDHRRQQQSRRPTLPPTDLEGLQPIEGAEPPTPESRELLRRALHSLKAVERQVYVRFHAREESIQSIAKALALPEGTVKSHLRRARLKLSRWRAPFEEDEVA